MTAIERTAYPRLKANYYRKNDLQLYLPTDEELDYMYSNDIRSDKMRLSFIVPLKTFQRLGYFPKLDAIPNIIIKQTRQILYSPRGMKPGYKNSDSKYRHRDLIRSYLNIDEDNEARDQLITQLANDAAQTMNDPANIINFVIEALVKQRYELPAFSSLDREICSIRHRINDDIFKMIRQRLASAKKITILTATLVKKDGEHKTPYNSFKRLPQKPTVTHFKELVSHNNWILEFGDFAKHLGGISKIKLEQFAEEARALDATALKAMRNENKKLSLIACLLAQAQCRTKDALALTFCRCVHDSEKDAERHYDSLAKNKNETAESIADLLLEMTTEFQIILRDEIKKRMPERNLLDIMCLVQNCTEWAHCFSPLSGSNAKLSDPIGANIVTSFGYGTGMGPGETARHVRAGFSAKTIASVNKSHVNLKKLNTALARIVDYYRDFPLVKAWGTGETVVVDGTLRKIYEQNLLAETHIRYGAKGGIAYHHISDTYIALFSSLIPCGTWEAIAIIEGLLRNESKIKPTKVHGDTQSQSTPVFSISYLFGIQLMPRIRNWKDLILYKADKRMKFKNINSLFKDTIDWKLIENYWQDMMQVVISIQQGKVSSDFILSKLNSRNKSSRLYKAFRELGNVIRTLFLLDFISDPDLRETITAETNKVESFNNLSDWIRFASEVIVASNDTKEMEKAIKYNTLLTNMIILQNVIDMSRIIQQLRREGWSITLGDLAGLSPYLTEHLKRFGDFFLDLSQNDGNIDKIKEKALVA